MHLIELDKLKQVNISFDTISELIIPNGKMLEMDIATAGNVLNEKRFFLVEIMLPANSCYYSLLGAKYIPTNSCNGLHVEIRYSDQSSLNYRNTLAYDYKTVFKGLSEEYVEAVSNTVIDYFSANEAPAGNLIFDTAAYCEVGSSPLMFKITTMIVLEILLGKKHHDSDDVKRICEKHLQARK